MGVSFLVMFHRGEFPLLDFKIVRSILFFWNSESGLFPKLLRPIHVFIFSCQFLKFVNTSVLFPVSPAFLLSSGFDHAHFMFLFLNSAFSPQAVGLVGLSLLVLAVFPCDLLSPRPQGISWFLALGGEEFGGKGCAQGGGLRRGAVGPWGELLVPCSSHTCPPGAASLWCYCPTFTVFRDPLGEGSPAEILILLVWGGHWYFFQSFSRQEWGMI